MRNPSWCHDYPVGVIVIKLTRNCPFVVDISLWQKFNLLQSKSYESLFLIKNLTGQMQFFKKSSWVWAYSLGLGLAMTPNTCFKMSNKYKSKVRQFDGHRANTQNTNKGISEIFSSQIRLGLISLSLHFYEKRGSGTSVFMWILQNF